MANPTGLRWMGLLVFSAALLTGACRGGAVRQEPVKLASLSEVADTTWQSLGTKRIFFGHKSVGANIMNGVADVLRDEPRIGLRVADGEGAMAGSGGVFAHGSVGKNGDPALKTDDFARLVEGPLRGKVDVAFHKYCYADVTEKTDVAAVFGYYQTTMARLRAEFPGVTFVHVTIPLVRVQSGPRAALKLLLGQNPGRYGANFARERFNDLMRDAYRGKEPLFDLAAIESTRPDGSREAIQSGKRSGYALVPAYTMDNSHLNEVGRRRVAEELLVFLARLPAPK
jgi:hypothetical protein